MGAQRVAETLHELTAYENTPLRVFLLLRSLCIEQRERSRVSETCSTTKVIKLTSPERTIS